MTEKVLVGFSGGVDSAMTSVLLRDQGFEVEAAMMRVRDADGRGCGATGEEEAALRLADRLGMPLGVYDCAEAYGREVLGRFKAEYLAGRTPNPCIECNPAVKFSVLPALARAAGVDFHYFATGHYARIEPVDGIPALRRGVDTAKDQSYFLYRLPRDILSRTLFPLGTWRKTDVRREALRRGIPVHDKPDSQDFYAGDYAELLQAADTAGDIVTQDGTVLGRHHGYWHFTPGQRKGLGIGYKEPLYVLRLDPGHNRVVVGARSDELQHGCSVHRLAFSFRTPREGETLLGKIRSTQPLSPMTVTDITRDSMSVSFHEAKQGLAPGQSLVLYEDDTVLGGGIITAPATPASVG